MSPGWLKSTSRPDSSTFPFTRCGLNGTWKCGETGREYQESPEKFPGKPQAFLHRRSIHHLYYDRLCRPHVYFFGRTPVAWLERIYIKNLQKNFLANRKLSFIAGQFIICIMIACVGLTFTFLGERLSPGWKGSISRISRKISWQTASFPSSPVNSSFVL